MSMAKKAPSTTPDETMSSRSPSIAPISDLSNHLANQFLIAMPGLADPNFEVRSFTCLSILSAVPWV